MKNLLFLIVFTITSFFNSTVTVFSQKTLTNPFDGEEVVLNEKQIENLANKESFLLTSKYHGYWIEAYTFNPRTKECINQSWIYTIMYFSSLLILFVFSFNFAFADKKWSLRNQVVVYLGILLYAIFISYIPFEWNFFTILIIGIVSIIISAGAIIETALTGSSFRNAVIVMAAVLTTITYVISYNAKSVGFYYCFSEFILPLVLWMTTSFIEIVLHSFFLMRKTVQESTMIVHRPNQ